MSITRASLLTCFVCLAACGGDGSSDVPTRVEPVSRSEDPRALALREAIEDADLERAGVLIEQVESRLGVEGPCLRARLSALEGDVLEAMRALESARNRWPGDPRPAATAVEVYAQLGRLEAAADEYNRAVSIFGRGPELMRAQGVLAIVTPGAAESGLGMLEEAMRADPGLPFLAAPLATARWLTARQVLARGEVDRAEELARGALELRPGDPDARITLADSLKGRGDFEGAIPWLEGLVAEGVAVEDELAQLHHAAATKAMLAGDREAQLAHYLAARANGFTDQQLGHGALALSAEAERLVGEGLEHERAAEDLSADASQFEAWRAALEDAEESYRAALVYDVGAVEANHRLGTVLFKTERYREAALAWEAAAARARVDSGGEPLPVPLELNAALAWERAERPDLARQSALDYLSREPEGSFAERALIQLERLEQD